MSARDRFLPIVLVLIFAAGCLGMTFMMPWAEFGLLTPSIPGSDWGKQFADTLGISGLLQPAIAFVNNNFSYLKDDVNAPYYVYGFFMALALISAAIGIAVIGREDAEEKTVLPLK
ncbi:MAG: hypothetical protein K2Y22_01280 [Candidatus Obscuribacterales bacterium]|nr:hypothetical protein [Candidatus Obscuribacterales bacterium]